MSTTVRDRLGAVAGAAFIQFILVAAPRPPTSGQSAHPTGDQVLRDAAHQVSSASVTAGVALEVLGFAAFLVFLGYLAEVLRRTAGGRRGSIAAGTGIVSGAVMVAVKLGSATPIMALWADRAALGLQLALALNDLGAVAFVISWLPSAIFVAAAAAALHRAGLVRQANCLLWPRILDPCASPVWLGQVRDSKVLQAPERERLSSLIRTEALGFGLGWATVGEIDGWGITLANRMAMARALADLPMRPQYVLIDGPSGIKTPHPQKAIIDGDALCATISAASIVAKVARDAIMCELDGLYPEYGFAGHKGYATRDHLDRIARYGASAQHRRSWPRVQLAARGLDAHGEPIDVEGRDAAAG